MDYVLFGDAASQSVTPPMRYAPIKVDGEEEEEFPETKAEKRSRDAYEEERRQKPRVEFQHPGGLDIVALPPVNTNLKEEREVNPNLPKLPFAACAVANQQTGKGTMLINMLLSPDMYKGVFKKIWLVATTAFKDGMWEFLNIPEEQKTLSYSASFGKKIEDFAYEYKEEHGKFPLQLVIFDDFLAVGEGHYNTTRNAIEACATSWRHANISMFVAAQSFNMMRVIGRQNMTAWFVFRMRSSDGFERFAKENIPIDPRLTVHWFRALYDYCVNGKEDSHSFLYINTRGNYRHGDSENDRYFKNLKPIPVEVLESFSALKPFTLAWMSEQRLAGSSARQQLSAGADLKFHEFDVNRLKRKYEEKNSEYDSKRQKVQPDGPSTDAAGGRPEHVESAAET